MSAQVINCIGDYKNSTDSLARCLELYKEVPFELSPFQKYAVEGIVNEDNVLVIAHTGSGKTLPAEILINHIVQNKHKKIIYTSPIKALSNQKYRDLKEKFPNISFGLITGDTKYFPDADCLIMTTEILRNTLVKMQMIKHDVLDANKVELDFELDIENDLSAVIFDEVHYINNKERGSVWGETIMMLPQTCQLLMLSASLDLPGKFTQSIQFSEWVSKKGKNVWICSTEERVVPLTHYSFMIMKDSDERKFTNKAILQDVKKSLGKPLLLKKQGGKFQESNFHQICRVKRAFEKYNINVSTQFVINKTVEMIKNKEELPALFFVFSRKMCEEYACKMSIPLFEKGNKNPSVIEKMCEKIIMSKISNWREYLQLPEYKKLVSVLKKGVAYHHSSVPQVLREMVEILFEMGDFIKLVFVTETFAVGINMPVKTVIFPKLNKYDGENFRALLPHEYTQMAGRAGRRNLDERGTVYHLNNLIGNRNEIRAADYSDIMSSRPPRMTSKFSIEPRLILELISQCPSATGPTEEIIENIREFINKSRLKDEIDSEIIELQEKLTPINSKAELEKTKLREDCGNKIDTLKFEDYRDMYFTLKDDGHGDYDAGRNTNVLHTAFLQKSVVEKMKKMEKDTPELLLCHEYLNALFEKETIEKIINMKRQYIDTMIRINLKYLKEENFLCHKMKDETEYIELMPKGVIASLINETNSLPIAEILEDKRLNRFSSKEIAGILSCFANAQLPEYYTIHSLSYTQLNEKMKKFIGEIQENIVNCENQLNRLNIEVKNNEDLQYNLCDMVMEWYDLNNEKDCLITLKQGSEYEITLGIWCKAIMKICNLARELEKVCNHQGNLELLSKLKQIPDMLLKSVVNNQSLYV